MAGDYKVQINVKIGDHLVNVNGESADEAMEHLKVLATYRDELHAALSHLDGGRSATEIVQKEKTWGARSQGGRTYGQNNQSNGASSPATAPSAPQWPQQSQQQFAVPGGAQPAFDPAAALQQQLGAVPIETVPNQVQFPPCPLHGQPLQYAPGGNRKSDGKAYSARWGCTQRGCTTVHWQQQDGSWS